MNVSGPIPIFTLGGVLAWGLMALWVLGGVWLAIRGWRGRWVGDHPHCRGCGFDLFGLYPQATGCPECGRVLRGAADARVGQRQRRRGQLTVGTAMLTVAVLLGGAMLVRTFSKAALYAWLPDAALVWVLNDEEARVEMSQRIAAGSVGGWATRRAVREALAVQADVNRPWEVTWGDLVESAWDAGQISQADAQRYAENAVALELEVRPQVKRGLAPACFLWNGAPGKRLGTHGRVKAKARLTQFTVDGQAISLSPRLSGDAGEWEAHKTGGSGSAYHLPLGAMPDRLGPLALTAIIELDYELQTTHAATPLRWSSPPFTLQASTEIVDHFTGSYITGGPSDADRARQAGVWVEVANSGRASPQDMFIFGVVQEYDLADPRAWVRVAGTLQPTDFDWDSWGSGSPPGGQPGQTMRFYRGGIDRDELVALLKADTPPTHFDLIVRTDVEQVETGAFPKTCWPGEWEFRDIPLDASPIAGQWDPHQQPIPPTLVPAVGRTLTVEEALGEPGPR